jgi:hypothetical protein
MVLHGATRVPVRGGRTRSSFRAVRVTLTGSASYATGGDTLPTNLGLNYVENVLVVSSSAGASDGHQVQYQLSGANAGKVKVVDNANAEVAAATDLSGASWDVLVVGR